MERRVSDHIAVINGVGSLPVTTSVYDMGDRRTEVNHPASGITSFTYDPLGNVLTKQTANMAEEGKMITYTYDYHRLTGVSYPDHPENNVKYYYGGRNASYNRIGRLMMREDGTGAIEYFYGKMGEVTKTRRTLIVPNQAIATYVTQWTYDSHNRLIEMIYPDEEKVTYSYNLGGLLEKVRGEKSYGYDYITKLGYDKFEQRSYLKYCNGAETFYTYDDRRRLSNLAVNSGGASIMDNAYTFDAVSNVLSVANNASLPANGNAGGQMSHTYTYDGLYRLATATGTYTGADSKSASYTLAMGYDNMHRIKSKRQHLTQDNVQFNGTLNVGYDLTYTYGSEAGKKFQLESVKDVNYRTEETPEGQQIENGHTYQYDKNGNLIYVNTNRVMTDGHRDNSVGERKLIWDEENRLLAVDDNGFVSNYWYDADGERTVKTSGESDQVFVNGVFSGGSTNTAKFSLYVSPYLVANQGGRYTKHIYAGSQRIVSKVGDFASYGSDPRRIEYAGANTDGLSVDYKSKYAAQQQVIKDNYKFFDVPYNGSDNDNYADGEGFCCNDGSMEAAVAQARKAQTRAVSRSFKDPDNYENLQFFYHPDHLGSSSFITNLDGEVVQHIEYVPFGEVFIEERNNVWNTPYLFNAKEFDEETGMYYYGARYYEPRLSLWISVDQKSESHPNHSAYLFSAGNPIKFIDTDGKDIVIHGQNDSQLVIATNLIDQEVNASALGLDWGGEFILHGEKIVSVGLDIVGIFDPTGIADITNCGLQLKNGEWFGAFISALGVAPYIGDIPKVTKIEVDYKILKSATHSIQMNRRIGEIAEAHITNQLAKKFGKEATIGEQITARFNDGTRVVFDNVVVKNGKVVLVNETKASVKGARLKLSPQQARFFEKGESVTFVGSKADALGIKGSRVSNSSTQTSVSRVEVKINE